MLTYECIVPTLIKGFGLTPLSGDHRGYMPPLLKTKTNMNKTNFVFPNLKLLNQYCHNILNMNHGPCGKFFNQRDDLKTFYSFYKTICQHFLRHNNSPTFRKSAHSINSMPSEYLAHQIQEAIPKM